MLSINLYAPSTGLPSQMGLMQLREEVACLKALRDSGTAIRHRMNNFQSCALTNETLSGLTFFTSSFLLHDHDLSVY